MGDNVKSETEAEKKDLGKEYIEQGIKNMRVYKLKDLLACNDYRSKKYLRSAAFNIWYLGSASSILSYRQLLDHKGIEYRNLGEIQNWGNATGSYNVKLYSYENKNPRMKNKYTYFAEYSIATRMDEEYITITYFFGKFPSRQDVTAAYLINTASSLAEDKDPEFDCSNCKKKVHWLDVKGDLAKKIEHWNHQSCGCKKIKA